jgi:hypothetical protein
MVKPNTIVIEKYSRRNVLFGQRRWLWRFRHINGNIMADSAEAYNSKASRDDALENIIGALLQSRYVIRDGDLGDELG